MAQLKFEQEDSNNNHYITFFFSSHFKIFLTSPTNLHILLLFLLFITQFLSSRNPHTKKNFKLSAIFSIQRSIDDFDSNALLSSYLTIQDSLFFFFTKRVFQSTPREIKNCAAVALVCLLSHNFSITSNPAFFFFFSPRNQFFLCSIHSRQRRVEIPRNNSCAAPLQQQSMELFFFSSYYTFLRSF